MRTRRTAYALLFLIASLAAAALYLLNQPRTDIVRARLDIPVLTQISQDQVELIRVSPADAPSNAATSLGEVVGRYAALPILAGQEVDRRAIEQTPGARALGFGATMAPGQVAFPLPVEPSQAVGGALAPGARIDVVAVPKTLGQSALASSSQGAPGPVVLGRAYLVLALRTSDGQPLDNGASNDPRNAGSLVSPKLGSVVIAIASEDVPQFAAAAVSSTFYLALSQQPGVAGTP
jgi:Flp pilus assembly protein CpaB